MATMDQQTAAKRTTRIAAGDKPSIFWRTLDQEHNNFNALRLVLAALVIVAHSFAICSGTGQRELLTRATSGQESFGAVAVDMFFVISGVFITASWFRSRSMQTFLYRRVLRIYPGFIAALMVSAVAIWATSPDFRHSVPVRFWLPDFVQDAFTLDYSSLHYKGMFATNPLPNEGNASLWTVQKEFCCYIIVAVIGMFSLFKYRKALLLLTGMSWTYYAAMLSLSHRGDHDHFPIRFITFFFMGMSAWLWRDKLRFCWPVAMAMLVVLGMYSRYTPVFSILLPIAGSYVILWLGLTSPWKILAWAETTDISYGVYLYGFLVQQVLALVVPLRLPLVNICLALPVTALLAWLSRRLVEEPFLRAKTLQVADFDPGCEGKTAVWSTSRQQMALTAAS